MRSFTITEPQLAALRDGIGRPLSNLEAIGVNMILAQVAAAEIKPPKTEEGEQLQESAVDNG